MKVLEGHSRQRRWSKHDSCYDVVIILLYPFISLFDPNTWVLLLSVISYVYLLSTRKVSGVRQVFLSFFLLIFLLMFIYFWKRDRERGRERKRQSVSRGGAEKEGGTESEAGSRFQAVNRGGCGAHTQEPRDHDLTWSQTLNQLSHPGTLRHVFLYLHRTQDVSKTGEITNSPKVTQPTLRLKSLTVWPSNSISTQVADICDLQGGEEG